MVLPRKAKFWRGLWPTGCLVRHVIDSITSTAPLLHALLNFTCYDAIVHLHANKRSSFMVNDFSLCGFVLRDLPALVHRQTRTYGDSAVCSHYADRCHADATHISSMASSVDGLSCIPGEHAKFLRGH